jgi:hypothetical protein
MNAKAQSIILTNDTFRSEPHYFSSGIIFSILIIILINSLVLNQLHLYSKCITKENIEYSILILTILLYNSVNWIMYSIWYQNMWLCLACLSIPLGSLMFIIPIYDSLTYMGKKIFQIVSGTFNIYLVIYIFLLNFSDIDTNTKTSIVNYSLLINMFTLVIPLASLSIVFRDKSVKTVYVPITIMNIIQSVVWLKYGMILNNMLLISIYCFGLIALLVEILLYAIYNKTINDYEKEKEMNVV